MSYKIRLGKMHPSFSQPLHRSIMIFPPLCLVIGFLAHLLASSANFKISMAISALLIPVQSLTIRFFVSHFPLLTMGHECLTVQKVADVTAQPVFPAPPKMQCRYDAEAESRLCKSSKIDLRKTCEPVAGGVRKSSTAEATHSS